MSMKLAVAIVNEAGYDLEQVQALRGAAWYALLEKATDESTRVCLQAIRWTGGDTVKLLEDRQRQQDRRTKLREAAASVLDAEEPKWLRALVA